MKTPKSGNNFNTASPFEKVKIIPIKKTQAQGAEAEDWFDDRQSLVAHAAEAEGEGETLWLLSYADMMTLLFGFFVMLSSFSKVDTDKFEKVRLQSTQLFGGEFKKAQNQLEEDIKDKISEKGLTNEAMFNELEKGIAITFRGSTFFESGSAELRTDAQELLNKVLPSIKKQQSRFSIVVEGHTDDSPISTDKFPSNWELSSQRASSVLRYFEMNGFDRTQLRAIGFADTVPVLPNRLPDNSPIKENQSQNRRVIIKLLRNASI